MKLIIFELQDLRKLPKKKVHLRTVNILRIVGKLFMMNIHKYSAIHAYSSRIVCYNVSQMNGTTNQNQINIVEKDDTVGCI